MIAEKRYRNPEQVTHWVLLKSKGAVLRECTYRVEDFKTKHFYHKAQREWARSMLPPGYISLMDLNIKHGVSNEEHDYIRECVLLENEPVCVVLVYANGHVLYAYKASWIADLFPPEWLRERDFEKYYVDTGV